MRRLVLLSTLASLALAGPARAQAVALRGPEGQTAADLAALPQVTRPARSARMVESIEVIRLADALPADRH